MFFIPENTPTNNGHTRYDSLVWFIIGEPMSGKSSFANSFPSPLWINTDSNYFQFDTPYIYLNKDGVTIKDQNGNELTYDAWEYFKNTIDELVNNVNTLTYKTLIIDLIEDTYEMCRQYVIKLHRKNHESEIGAFGQGYALVKEEFMGTMNKVLTLRQHGWNILMLSHQKIANVKTLDEKVQDTQYASMLTPKIESKLKGISHITGRTSKIMTTIQTDKGPQAKEEFILKVSEPQSIASNRIFLPFNEVYLSYSGWRNAVGTITNAQIEKVQEEQEGENNV